MHILLWSLFSLLLIGCKSTGPAARGPVTIEFKGRAGAQAETRYYSSSHILTYEEGQLVRDRVESVEFTTQTRYVGVGTSSGSEAANSDKTVAYSVKTVRKDGQTDLHDLAFPELHEEIEFVIRSTGEVLRASGYPPNSLFYVPSLPIPKEPVEVGDTWALQHAWRSAKQGIPLQLDVVGILKDVVRCEGNKLCADLEVSGAVRLAGVPSGSVRFTSRVWGRLLFSLERGDVIWSLMRSREDMGTKERTVVSSCMNSETKIRLDYKLKLECDPKNEAVTEIPKL